MNIFLNYVVNNIYRDSGKRLRESLFILDNMLKEKQVNGDDIVKLNIDGSEVKLKKLLFDKYNSDPEKEILELLLRYSIEDDLSNKEAYLSLLNTLKAIKREYIPHKVDEALSAFFSLKIPAEKIVNHIKETIKNEVDDPESYESINILFQTILESDANVKLFKSIFLDYLGEDNIMDMVKDYIASNYISLTFTYPLKGVNLCNAYPDLGNIEINKGSFTLIEEIILNSPEKINALINLSEDEKNKLINLYFEEKIEIEHPHLKNIEEVLMKRKDWFRTQCGSRDIINVFANSGSHGVAEVLNKLKEKGLKEYLLERKDNLLVEYLNNNNGRIVKSHYKKIIKTLPQLLTKENKKGVLDIFYNNVDLTILGDEKLELFKTLPSRVLLTSDEKELLKWVNEEVIISYTRVDNNQDTKKRYNEIYNLIVSCINLNFSHSENEKVSDALKKLDMQYKITRLFQKLSSSEFEERINKEIESVIEKSGLNAHKLSEMMCIENLFLNGYLEEDYIPKMKVKEEKNILLNSISSDNEYSPVKKRI